MADLESDQLARTKNSGFNAVKGEKISGITFFKHCFGKTYKLIWTDYIVLVWKTK